MRQLSSFVSSIRFRLLVTMAVIAVVPSVVVSYAQRRDSQAGVRQTFEELLRRAPGVGTVAVERFRAELSRGLYAQTYENPGIARAADPAAAASRLKPYSVMGRPVTMGVYDPLGELVARAGQPAGSPARLPSALLAGLPHASTSVVELDGVGPSVVALAPLQSAGELRGWVAAFVPLDASLGQYVSSLTGTDVAFYSHDGSPVRGFSPSVSELLAGDGAVRIGSVAGAEALTASAVLRGPDGKPVATVLYSTPLAVVTAAAGSVSGARLAGPLIALVLVLIGIAGAAWWLQRGLRVLAASARRFASGDLETPVPSDVLAELRDVSRALEDARRQLFAAREERAASARVLEATVSERTMEVRRAYGQLDLLYQLARHTGETLSVEGTLARAIETIGPHFGAQAAVAYRFEAETQQLIVEAHHGMDGAEIARVGRQRVGPDAVEAGARAAHLGDLEERPVGSGQIDVGVPLRYGTELLGAVELRGLPWPEWDRGRAELLRSIGSQLSQAVVNARTFERERSRADDLDRLQRATAAVNAAGSSADARRTAVQAAQQLLRADSVVWASSDDPEAAAEACRGDGEPFVRAAQPLERVVAGLAGVTGQPVFVDDVLVDPVTMTVRGSAGELGMRALAALPVRGEGGRVHGVAVVGFREPHSMPGHVRAVAALLATHAGTTLDRTLLLETAQEHAGRESLLNRLSARFRESLEVEQLAAEALAGLRRGLGLQYAGLVLAPESGKMLAFADPGPAVAPRVVSSLHAPRFLDAQPGTPDATWAWVGGWSGPAAMLPIDGVALRGVLHVVGPADASAWSDLQRSALEAVSDVFAAGFAQATLFRAARETRDRLEYLINNLEDVIFQLDLRAGATVLSRRWQELTGVDVLALPPEEHARALLAVVHPDDRVQAAAAFQDALRGNPASAVLRHRSADGGYRTFAVRYAPARDPSGRVVGLQGIARDIEDMLTAQRTLEERNRELDEALRDLQEANAQLAEADRLKSEFLANTSHELRTPLTAILGFLRLILDGLCESREEEMQLLEEVHSSSRNLLGIINDILDIAKIEAGHMDLETREVCLAEVLERVRTLTRVQAQQKGLAMCFDVDPDLRVLADEGKVEQVLVNLVGNALKFTNDGSITVTAALLPDRHAVRVSVRDTGLGVPPERQHLLFQKFRQADGSTTRRFGGTGLGLAICRSLVELMGGTIWLESEGLGHGTTVSFTLWPPPLAALDSEPVILGVVPGDGRRGCSVPDGGLVLLIDDDPVCRAYLQRMLELRGLRVPVATGPRAAASAARAVKRRGRALAAAMVRLTSTGECQDTSTGWDLLRRLRQDMLEAGGGMLLVTRSEAVVRRALGEDEPGVAGPVCLSAIEPQAMLALVAEAQAGGAPAARAS